MDHRQDSEAWADAFLDQHRTGPRRDRERERAEAARALQELPRSMRWTLTRGGHQPDLDTIRRIQRNSRFHATAEKWEAIFTIIGVSLLVIFAVVWSGVF